MKDPVIRATMAVNEMYEDAITLTEKAVSQSSASDSLKLMADRYIESALEQDGPALVGISFINMNGMSDHEIAFVFNELQSIDPEHIKFIHMNDNHGEYKSTCVLTNLYNLELIKEFAEDNMFSGEFDTRACLITPDRDLLRNAFDQFVAAGFAEQFRLEADLFSSLGFSSSELFDLEGFDQEVASEYLHEFLEIEFTDRDNNGMFTPNAIYKELEDFYPKHRGYSLGKGYTHYGPKEKMAADESVFQEIKDYYQEFMAP